MKCPNCGSFIDDGREVCFICGANISEAASTANGNFNNNQSFNDNNMNQGFNNSNNMNMGNMDGQSYNNMGQVPDMNQNFGMDQNTGMNQMPENAGFGANQNYNEYPNNGMYGNQMYGGGNNNFDNGGFGANVSSTSYSDTSGNMLDNSPQFSTGMGDSSKSFGTNNGGFNTSNGYSIKSNLQEELNKNGSEKYFKNGEKDIFDFIEEHKMIVRIGLCVLLVVILFLAGRLYYNARLRETEPTGVVGNLYLEYDKSLVATSASNALVLSRNNGVNSDCVITINTNGATSDTYVDDIFKETLKKYEPERDVNYNIINNLDIYSTQQGSYDLAGVNWNYLNVFYKDNEQSQSFKILKYIVLTSNYKGVNYNVEVKNSSNDTSCRYSVDNVIKSFRFVENAASK